MLKKIDRFLNKRFSAKVPTPNKADVITLLMNWENIVGTKLAEVSLPQRITKNNLYIVVNHSIYAQHLKQMSEVLLEKIFSHYPGLKSKIHELKFFFSEKAFREVEISHHRKLKEKEHEEPYLTKINLHDPVVKNAMKEANHLFKDVDPELRESLVSLYIQNRL